ncbi:hypothetical protein D9758_008581 [Tetrapyrgos nigripes]|uniref:Uncharacterized protein n=1 Tax=Tetrapyrgos nigripes TaxID=182062 RepID=A0A8H5G5I9_9AGAR|nr:hypothetical protein D9758_008581 [Tetrapyrgos nigripes]
MSSQGRPEIDELRLSTANASTNEACRSAVHRFSENALGLFFDDDVVQLGGVENTNLKNAIAPNAPEVAESSCGIHVDDVEPEDHMYRTANISSSTGVRSDTSLYIPKDQSLDTVAESPRSPRTPLAERPAPLRLDDGRASLHLVEPSEQTLPRAPRLRPICTIVSSTDVVVASRNLGEVVDDSQITPLLLPSPFFSNRVSETPLANSQLNIDCKDMMISMPPAPKLRPIPLPDVENTSCPSWREAQSGGCYYRD